MTQPVRLIELGGLAPAERAKLLGRAEADLSAFIERVRPIIEAVQAEGDEALARFAREFDKAPLDCRRHRTPPRADFDAAFDAVDRKVIAAIEFAVDDIRRFHEAQKPEEMWLKEIRPGAFAGDRCTPDPVGRLLRAARQGLLSQRGHDDDDSRRRRRRAADRSSSRRPGPTGRSTPATPGGGAARRRRGGLQVRWRPGRRRRRLRHRRPCRSCVKIVGPGSPYVVAAKRLLADVIDPGMPAGPSESIVLADETAERRGSPRSTCIVESEHGPDSSAFLVTHSRAVAEAAIAAIPELLGRRWASQRVAFSATVLVRPARRHRARPRSRCGRSTSSTTTRPSIWRSCPPSPSTISAASAMPARSCWATAHADHPRQFRPRPQRGAADLRRGAHLLAAVGASIS